MREAELLEALEGVVRRCGDLEFQLGESKIDCQRQSRKIADLEESMHAAEQSSNYELIDRSFGHSGNGMTDHVLVQSSASALPSQSPSVASPSAGESRCPPPLASFHPIPTPTIGSNSVIRPPITEVPVNGAHKASLAYSMAETQYASQHVSQTITRAQTNTQSQHKPPPAHSNTLILDLNLSKDFTAEYNSSQVSRGRGSGRALRLVERLSLSSVSMLSQLLPPLLLSLASIKQSILNSIIFLLLFFQGDQDYMLPIVSFTL